MVSERHAAAVAASTRRIRLHAYEWRAPVLVSAAATPRPCMLVLADFRPRGPLLARARVFSMLIFPSDVSPLFLSSSRFCCFVAVLFHACIFVLCAILVLFFCSFVFLVLVVLLFLPVPRVFFCSLWSLCCPSSCYSVVVVVVTAAAVVLFSPLPSFVPTSPPLPPDRGSIETPSTRGRTRSA